MAEVEIISDPYYAETYFISVGPPNAPVQSAARNLGQVLMEARGLERSGHRVTAIYRGRNLF